MYIRALLDFITLIVAVVVEFRCILEQNYPPFRHFFDFLLGMVILSIIPPHFFPVRLHVHVKKMNKDSI